MTGFRVKPDGSELVQYTMEGLPVRATGSSLSAIHGYAAACHWHDDFEMLVVPKGEIDYFVNGKSVHLKQGEGIFVNARRLHYGYSALEQNCRYRFVVFHPDLIGDHPAIKRALEPFTSDTNADYWRFDASPMEYLTRYRLDKACDMLRQGSTVTETALSNGFHSQSYFTEVFRRMVGKPPKQ